MAAPRNPVENAQRIRRLYLPHVLVLGQAAACLACRVDDWVRRARFAARADYTYASLAQIRLAANGARIVQPVDVIANLHVGKLLIT